MDMKIEQTKQNDLKTLSTEELHNLFQEVNSTLAKNMMNGARLQQQQVHINMLNDIFRNFEPAETLKLFCLR